MQEEISTFIEVFVNTPFIKVLDFFLTYRDFDYPMTEITENSGIAWSTLHQIFPKLLKLEIVKKTRGIGRAKLYMLNKENQIVKDLIEIDNRIMKHLAEIDNRKEIVKA